jgi:hypothetical protein
MKIIYFLFVTLVCYFFLLCGCTLETNSPTTSTPAIQGSDLVISEIYKISPSMYYSYAWIELYNPTNQVYRWYTRDSLDTNTIVTTRLLIEFKARLKIYNNNNPSYILYQDTTTAYFSNYYDNINFFGPPASYFDNNAVNIYPGQYVLAINNQQSFDEHWHFGGTTEPAMIVSSLPDNNLNIALPLCLMRGDDIWSRYGYIYGQAAGQFGLRADSVNYRYYDFPAQWDLTDDNQVSLIREIDTIKRELVDTLYMQVHHVNRVVIDMVRFGKYNDGIDLGTVPEGSSVARHSNNYNRGNFMEEFYIEPVPVPGYGSPK